MTVNEKTIVIRLLRSTVLDIGYSFTHIMLNGSIRR